MAPDCEPWRGADGHAINAQEGSMGCFAVALGLLLIVLGTVLTMVGVGAILGVPIGLVGS